MNKGIDEEPPPATDPAVLPGPAPAEPAGEPIRKRRIARGWRRFGIEIGTIVLGILIALGLDQMAQASRDASAAAEAREAIRAEITIDITRVNERGKAQVCVDARLDELQAMLDDPGADGRIKRPNWIGRPPRYGIETQRWDAASQSGRTSLFKPDELGRYGFLYTTLAYFYDMENSEQLTWSKLSALENVDRLTDDGRLTMHAAIAEARFYNASIRQVGSLLLERAGQLDIMPTPRAENLSNVCWPSDLSPEEVKARLKARGGPL